MAARVPLLCLAMFLCASLQGTDSVESPVPEQLYWAIVAMILYRSWFTVAPGWTLGCSIIHHGFILVDSGLAWPGSGVETPRMSARTSSRCPTLLPAGAAAESPAPSGCTPKSGHELELRSPRPSRTGGCAAWPGCRSPFAGWCRGAS